MGTRRGPKRLHRPGRVAERADPASDPPEGWWLPLAAHLPSSVPGVRGSWDLPSQARCFFHSAFSSSGTFVLPLLSLAASIAAFSTTHLAIASRFCLADILDQISGQLLSGLVVLAGLGSWLWVGGLGWWLGLVACPGCLDWLLGLAWLTVGLVPN